MLNIEDWITVPDTTIEPVLQKEFILELDDWINAGYKRFNQATMNNSDYLVQKLFADDKGKRYYLTVYVYEHFNKEYYSRLLPGISKFSFTPDVQFQQGDKPTVDIKLILSKDHTIKDVEQQIEVLWESLGKPYYELYDNN